VLPPGREPGEAEAVRDDVDDDDNGDGDSRGLALRAEWNSGSESESEVVSWRRVWLSPIMAWFESGMA